MEVFTKGSELSHYLSLRDGIKGFVPTMGALHDGHRSLVELCRAECGTVVVSIFVNPTQFNDPSDLQSYPRTPEKDLEMLRKAGADVVYTPSVEDIYPEPDSRVFDFGLLDKVMEGAHRPGHFNGVAQVVSRLFDIVRPDKAYFGEKDFQQLAIIRQMARTLSYGIQIVGCPIVRERSGLALSSRNALLAPQVKEAAPTIYKALKRGAEAAGEGMDLEAVKELVTGIINGSGQLETEYFDIVDADTLQSVANRENSPSLRGCVAVRAGGVRLIDNIDIV